MRQQHLILYNNQLIHVSGAAPGNVAESVILERESESTMMFVEGAKNAYAGHLTLKFSPDVTSTVPHNKHYCLEVGENCSPTIDHCIIRSSSVGMYKCDFLLEFLVVLCKLVNNRCMCMTFSEETSTKRQILLS